MKLSILQKKSKSDPKQRKFLKGQVVKTEDSTYYINKNSRQEFKSHEVLESYGVKRIVSASEEQLTDYPKVGKMPFKVGTLIFDTSSGDYHICQEGPSLVKVNPRELSGMGIVVSDAIQVYRAGVFGTKGSGFNNG